MAFPEESSLQCRLTRRLPCRQCSYVVHHALNDLSRLSQSRDLDVAFSQAKEAALSSVDGSSASSPVRTLAGKLDRFWLRMSTRQRQFTVCLLQTVTTILSDVRHAGIVHPALYIMWIVGVFLSLADATVAPIDEPLSPTYLANEAID